MNKYVYMYIWCSETSQITSEKERAEERCWDKYIKKNIQKNKQEVLYHFTDTFVKCCLDENLMMAFIYCLKEIIVREKKMLRNVKRQDHHHREGLIKSKYMKKKIMNSYWRDVEREIYSKKEIIFGNTS